MKFITWLLSFFTSFAKKAPTVSIPVQQPPVVPQEPRMSAPAPKLVPPTPRELLYTVAVACLGTDASPHDLAPDVDGCAETVNEIYKRAFGHHICDPDISTTLLFHTMRDNPDRFQGVISPLPGDIIISPTGYGINPAMPHGHTGIVAKTGIMSNDSYSTPPGLFKENYTIQSWNAYFHVQGGYPVFYFRPV